MDIIVTSYEPFIFILYLSEKVNDYKIFCKRDRSFLNFISLHVHVITLTLPSVSRHIEQMTEHMSQQTHCSVFSRISFIFAFDLVFGIPFNFSVDISCDIDVWTHQFKILYILITIVSHLFGKRRIFWSKNSSSFNTIHELTHFFISS